MGPFDLAILYSGSKKQKGGKVVSAERGTDSSRT